MKLLTEREKICETVDQAQKYALVKAMQEICDVLGISRTDSSPSDIVNNVRNLHATVSTIPHLSSLILKNKMNIKKFKEVDVENANIMIVDKYANSKIYFFDVEETAKPEGIGEQFVDWLFYSNQLGYGNRIFYIRYIEPNGTFKETEYGVSYFNGNTFEVVSKKQLSVADRLSLVRR